MEQTIAEVAVAKLDEELGKFKGGQRENVIKTYVANMLKQFCSEDNRFAEVIARTPRTLSDCCAEIIRGAGNAISDIEAYRRAARFYFPNSEVQFKMLVEITGDKPSDEEIMKPAATPAKDKKEKKPQQKEALPVKEKELVPAQKMKPVGKRTQDKDFMQLSLFGN